ncbi:MAG: ABC transporter permease [Endomicrobiales bacterium]|nr:ABC transporter permease [Endomicrobiales bacterium]
MPIELFIALRYLKARRKGVFTLLTTVIAVGGTTLGVAALVITLAVMSGFHRDIKEKILGIQPHLIILKEASSPFAEHSKVRETVSAEKQVRASSPFVYGQAVLRNNRLTSGVVLKGVDPAGENEVVGLNSRIIDGKKQGPADKEILLGNELAANLGAITGSEIIVMAPGPSAAVPRMEKLTVSGIFRSGMYEYDANLAYVNLSSGRKIFSLGEAVTGIGVSLKDFNDASEIEKKLQERLMFPYYVRSWQRMNRSLFAALKLEKIMMFIILALIIIVAAFNIISNLILLTIEKTRDIGILSAMGFAKAKIARVFLFEGLIIGLSGIFSGLFLGLGLSLALKKYQFIHLPADVYYIDTLPVRIIPADIAMVAGAALIITVVSAVYPAYQVTKLDPLEAIRYG